MNKLISRLTTAAVSFSLLVFLLMNGFTPPPAAAATGAPLILGHQGRLLDAAGNLLGTAGGTTFCFKFSLYDDAAVGAPDLKFWPAGAPSTMPVLVRTGVYNVGIGDTTAGGDALTYDFQADDEIYLNIEVATLVGATCAAGDGAEAFENLGPRERVFASGYALNANTLGGFTAAQSASGGRIPVLTGDNLILGGANPQINVTGANTLTLQNGLAGDLRFFSAANVLTSTGNLTVAGTATGAGFIANGAATDLRSGTNEDLTLDPNGTGNLTVVGLDCTGNANGGKLTASGTGVISCADDVNTTYTNGSGVSLAGTTFSLNLLTVAADGLSATANSASGLELLPSGRLSLLQGCANNEILKWDEALDNWICAADNAGGGGANSFETWSVPSGTNPVADSATDTVTITAGTGLTITGTAASDTINFAVNESTLTLNNIGGALGPTKGGTGISSYVTGDLLYASAANALSALPVGSNGQILKVILGVPTWGADTDTTYTAGTGISISGGNVISNAGILSVTASGPLSASVGQNPNITLTGTVGVGNGGTGLTAYSTGSLIYASAVNTLSSLPASADGLALKLAGGVPVWSPDINNVYTAGTGISISGGNVVSNTGVLTVGASGALSSTGGANPSISLTGTVGVSNGGTGNTAYASGDFVAYDGTKIASTGFTSASFSATGHVHSNLSQGAGIVAFSYNGGATATVAVDQAALSLSSIGGSLNLASQVTGILPVGNGGTGLTAYSTGSLIYASAVNTLSSLPASADGLALKLAGGVPVWSPDLNNVYTAGAGISISGGNVVSADPSGINMNSLAGGPLSATNGGTGVNGGAAANGTLLIGNGAGYSLATLTAGTNMTVTNGAGSVSLAVVNNPTFSGLITGQSGLTVQNAAIVLGNNTAPVSVDSDTWDVSSAGMASGLTGLTSTGNVNFSGANMVGASPLIFDGLTVDANKTTLAVANPTAPRVITLPNASGIVAVSATAPVTLSAVGDIGCASCVTDVPNAVLARIGSSTFSTLQDMQDVFHSAGWTSGGAITDGGGGTVNVAAGTGLIRDADNALSAVKYFDWAATSGLTIPSNSVRYVGIEYNGGSPQVTLRTSSNWNYKTDFPLGIAVNETGTVHIHVDRQSVGDHAANMIWREYETMPLSRDERGGGIILGESGTRNVTVSAGVLWDRLNRSPISAIDTSVSGSFEAYYRNGSGGFLRIAGLTQWPNTQFDDNSGALATMTGGYYGVLWFYLETDGDLIMVYGRGEYASAGAADSEMVPDTLPNRLLVASRLIGKLVFQKSASVATEVVTAFMSQVASTLSNSHSNLSNLDFTSAGHTGFAMSGANTNINSLSVISALDNTGAMVVGGTTATALGLGRSGIVTTVNGSLTLSGANITGGSPLSFEGASVDGNKTVLTVTDPTGARTITLPDASGVVAVTATGPITLSAAGDIACPTCVASANSFVLAASSGPNSAIAFGGTVTLAAGTNLTTSGNGAGTVTFATVASPAFTSVVTGATTYGSGSLTSTGTLTFNAGASTMSLNPGTQTLVLGPGTNTILNSDASTDLVLNPSRNLKISDGHSLVVGSAASDPTGASAVDGAVYYNTTSDTFRCFKSGAWAGCDAAAWFTVGGVSYLRNNGDQVGIGTNAPLANVKLQVVAEDANNSGETHVLVLDHKTTGVAAPGVATAILLRASNAAGIISDVSHIEAVFNNTTAGSETSDLLFTVRNGGAAAAEQLRVLGNGNLQLTGGGALISDVGTLTIGGSGANNVAITDAQWSVTAGGAASFVGLNSAGGAVTLNSPGASSFTSGGALTITAGAASIWSTTAGSLSLQVAGAGTTDSIQIGSGGAGSTTPDLLVMDVKSDAGDPAGANGAMYYNANANKFRCYVNGSWADCDTTGGSSTLQSAYNNGATITTAGATDIALTLTSGNLTATGAGSVLLTPSSASSFTSGGALTLTAGAASTWGTTSGALSLVSGTGSLRLGTGTNAIANADASTDLVLTPTGNLKIANSSLFVSSSQAADPTGTNGAMYYNTGSNKFRCYVNGSWSDCDTTGGTASLQSAYNNGNGITTAGAADIAFTLTSGNFTAAGAGAVSLTPTAASSFTSGGALTLTAGAASTWGTTVGNLSLQVAGSGTSASVQIGSGAGSATPDLLVVDLKSDAGDPSGTNGAMYYNVNANKFRCFVNGSWSDCDTTGGTASLQSAYNAGATITTSAATDIAFTLTSGNFTAAGAGAVSLTPTAASSFTSGGALTLTAGAASTWSTSAGTLTVQGGSGTVSLGTSTALTANTGLAISTGSGNLTLQPAGAGTMANVQIGVGGAGSTTPDMLVLDVKSTAGDPSGTAGAMYYNAVMDEIRCYEHGVWKDCDAYSVNPVAGIGTPGEVTFWDYPNSVNRLTGDSMFFWDTTTDRLGIGTNTPAAKLHLVQDDAVNNGVTAVLLVDHTTSGAPASGLGAAQLFRNENSSAAAVNTAQISAILTNVTAGAESGILTFATRSGGGALTERLRIDDAGHLLPGTTNNALDVGAAGNAWRTGRFGTSVIAGTTAYASGTVTAAGALSLSSGASANLTLISSSGSVALGAGTNTLINTDGGTDIVLNSTRNVKIDDSSLLVLASQGADPASPPATDGAMYYNTGTGRFRCYQVGSWSDCGGGTHTLQLAYDGGGTITTAATTDIAFNLASGNFTAAGTGSVLLTPTGASSFTSGGALTLTAGAASTWSTSAGALTIDSAAGLNFGTTNATALAVGRTGITTTVNGGFMFGNNTGTGAVNTTDWDISTVGAMTGISGLTNDGNYAQTGATSFSTGTGAISLNGATTIAANQGLTMNSGTGAFSQTYAAAADSSATNSAHVVNLNTPADTTGTNTHQALVVAATIGNATGGTNTANLVQVNALTGDAQVTLNGLNIGALTGTAATETALNIGAGWDNILSVGGTAVINGSGQVLAGQITGNLFTLAGTSGSSSTIARGGTATVGAGTNITTSGNGAGTVTVATVADPTFATSVSTPTLTNASADLVLNTSLAGNIVLQPSGAGIAGYVQIGAGGVGSTTPDLLALDVKSNAGDPTGANGIMYYNASTNKMRCYENGAWKDCDTVGVTSTRLDQLLAAAATNTIANADFAQTWNWGTLTSQTALTIGGSTTMTTGSLFSVGSGTYVHTAAETGNLLNLSFTDASTNASGVSVTNGLAISSTINTSGAGFKTVNGLRVNAPTITGCVAGGCDWDAIEVSTAALTQSTANIFEMDGFEISSAGALVQDTAAGTINWRGLNVVMPNITQTTGTINSVGLKVTGGTVTSGSSYAFISDTNAGNVGIGTVTPTRSLDVNGTMGGNAVISNQTLTSSSTVTVSTKGVAYYLKNDSGTTDASVTTTFNVTGLPEVDGTYAFIQLTAAKGITASARTQMAILQINATEYSRIVTDNVTTADSHAKTFTVVRVNGVWLVMGASGDGLGNAGQGLLIKSKTADESVTSSAAMQDDDELFFPVGANENWSAFLSVQATAATAQPDIQFQFTAPSGAVCDISYSLLNSPSSGAGANQACGVAQVNIAIGAGENVILFITANIKNGSTAGNVNFQWAQNSSNATATTVLTGSFVHAFMNVGSDLAEAYYTRDNSIGHGDLVALDSALSTEVRKTAGAYDPGTVGVISTMPGMILGDGKAPEGAHTVFVALSGRVPVKVTKENGALAIGDPLTASSLPGVAMKATKAGAIIGRALGAWDGEGVGVVTVMVSAPASPDGIFTRLADGGDSAAVNRQILESLAVDLTAATMTELRVDRVMAGLAVISNQGIFNGLQVDSIGAIGDVISLASDVSFIGRPYFNADTAGFAKVVQGRQSVDVTFDRDYLEQPVVSASISLNDGDDAAADAILNQDVRFVLARKTLHGFSIRLNRPAPTDILFSWIALAVKNAKLFGEEPAALPVDSPVGPSENPSEETVPAVEDSSAEETPVVTSEEAPTVPTEEAQAASAEDSTTEEVPTAPAEETPMAPQTAEETVTAPVEPPPTPIEPAIEETAPIEPAPIVVETAPASEAPAAEVSAE